MAVTQPVIPASNSVIVKMEDLPSKPKQDSLSNKQVSPARNGREQMNVVPMGSINLGSRQTIPSRTQIPTKDPMLVDDKPDASKRSTNPSNDKNQPAKKERSKAELAMFEYVRLVLSNTPSSKKAVVQAKIKKLLNEAKAMNAVETTDWGSLAFPEECTGPQRTVNTYSSGDTGKSFYYSTNAPPDSKKRKADLSYKSDVASPAAPVFDTTRIGSRMDGKKPKKDDDEFDSDRAAERAVKFKKEHEAMERERRDAQKKAEEAQHKAIMAGAAGNPEVIDWDEFTYVGTNQKLEKRYLRLTKAPDPSTVRPIEILRKTYAMLMDKWKSWSTEDRASQYNYICDQFKSLRQDLVVQRIRSEFTVLAYETHAELAIEQHDLNEFNQCQAQLKQLYEVYRLPGRTDMFVAYRILYMIHTNNQSDMVQTLSELTAEQKEGECVKHALLVRSALSEGSYHKFFKLYHNPPKASMSSKLMDLFVDRERQEALLTLLYSFRQTLTLDYIACTLGFVPTGVAHYSHTLFQIQPESENMENNAFVRAVDGYKNTTKMWLKENMKVEFSGDDDNFVDCKAALSVVSEIVRANTTKGVEMHLKK